MIQVTIQPATPERFAAFGRLAQLSGAAPTSHAADYQFWSDLAHYTVDGETEIDICTVFRTPAAGLATMERHLRTPEILIPIDAPFILPLLRDGDAAGKAAAFRVEVGQAVVIDPGIWHGACLPDGRERSSYWVIFRRHTPAQDVEKKEIPLLEISV
ncbi:MAG TPA: ureidoglycolate lyase [bacterium]|nr:ureidoglycolate lyase [bacterium]